MIVIWRINQLKRITCQRRKGGTHERHGGNEVILDRGIGLKYVDVHAEKPHQECQRQEDERDPAEPPQTGVELEGLARVADADGFVQLKKQISVRSLAKERIVV